MAVFASLMLGLKCLEPGPKWHHSLAMTCMVCIPAICTAKLREAALTVTQVRRGSYVFTPAVLHQYDR
jgi:hypothetical protein